MNGPSERAKQLMSRMLAKELYVIQSTGVAPREQIEAGLEEHLEHQIRLEKSGVLFAAGPTTHEDGSRGPGMIVIRAKSFADAREIAMSDPMHRTGMRSFIIMKWSVNEGSYSVRVNYSDQSVRID